MPIKNIQHKNVDIVYLYDPLSLDQLWIDKIRDAKLEESKLFNIISLLEDQALILESSKRKIRSTIQVSRLEYGDRSGVVFRERNLEPLEILLKCLPYFKVKAIGVNLHSSGELENTSTPGKYITDTFIKNPDDIQKKLNKPIIGTSVRLFYGEKMDHYDLRIQPQNLSDNIISISLHKHKDIDVVDRERLMEITKEMFSQVSEENDKIPSVHFGG